MKIPDDLIIEACKELDLRRQNNGAWIDGVPDIFDRLLEFHPNLKDSFDKITILENIVKIESIRILSNQVAKISDLDNFIKMLQRSEMPYKIVEDKNRTLFDIDYATMVEVDNKGSRSSMFDKKMKYDRSVPIKNLDTGSDMSGIGYLDHCSVWLFDKNGSLVIMGHYE